jgi:hypothetical protein
MNLVAVLLGGGGGAILLAAFNAIVARKKLAADTDKAGAEATSVLTAAAVALVKPLNDQIHDLEIQLERVRAKATQLEDQLDAARGREEAGLAREAAKDALIAELTR